MRTRIVLTAMKLTKERFITQGEAVRMGERFCRQIIYKERVKHERGMERF
jgi:hypothetical protein